MFQIGKKLIVATVVGASIFLGSCGDCRFPEVTYEALPSTYEAIETGQAVTGSLNLLPYKRSGFNIPNRYQVVCGTKKIIDDEDDGGPFDIFVSKVYEDGDIKLLVGTSGAPSRSIASNVLGPVDLEGVVDLKCSISIPERWECGFKEVCEYNVCHIEDVCSLEQTKKLIGMVDASLTSSEDCYDWYYDDSYIIRDPEKLEEIKNR